MLQDSNQNLINREVFPHRILQVDDDKAILTILYRHATRLGFSADQAGNGNEAMELLKKHSYDLVIFSIIKKHSDQGARILRPISFDERISDTIQIIRHHHERFDGKGYPDGLTAAAIPLYSRVIAIADSYDAMASDRPYRSSMNHGDALAEIDRNSGQQFDPVLAGKFVRLMRGCHDGKPCPSLATCEVFLRIEENVIFKAYEMQYCRTNFKTCPRYKIKNKGKEIKNLLPDGSLFIGDLAKKAGTGCHIWQER